MTTDDGIEFVRTPDACFEKLPNWPYEPQYVEIDGLRQAYVDEGPVDGPVVLLLHGQPSWSYLYRKMIPVLADAGYRVISMDHLGMGRSDKPIDIEYYSYLGHVDRLEKFIKDLNLEHITMFCQDWGSLIGLRVAGENPEWFARIVVGDGTLPVVPAGIQPYPSVENSQEINTEIIAPFAAIPPQQPPFFDEDGNRLIPGDLSTTFGNWTFGNWMVYSMTSASFHPAEVVEAMTYFDLSPEEEAAYDAPFPSRIYMAGPRVFPSLVNELPGETEEAWAGLTAYEKPFLTIWASNDPGNLGQQATQDNLINNIPGAAGQPHVRLPEASHFLQDDQGAEIARRIFEFIEATKNDPNAATTEEASERVGFEILEIQSPTSVRAWISPDITFDEFDALEVPQGWLKNQPRESAECGADAGRFLKSPESTMDGEILQQEFFGFNWFHAATVTKMNIPLDDEGLLTGTTVRKFHELTYNAGSCLVLLISPEGDVYFRVGRDAGRVSDEPTIPNLWRLFEYTTPDQLVIELFEENVVIRTDNQDSFQGPVPELAALASSYAEDGGASMTDDGADASDNADASDTTDASDSSEASGSSFTLKMLERTGENLFANLAYECDACSFEQFAAITPPPGWSKSPTQMILPIGDLKSALSFEGIPSSMDFVPEIPGNEFELIAKTLDGKLVENSENVLMLVANVMRETRLRFPAGNRVHELTDPEGNIFVLFAYEVDSADFDRAHFEDADALANYPHPDGWAYSTRIVDEELVLDSEGVVTVLSIGGGTSSVWEKR